ncbi:hypothetical protein VIGAN_08344500 [Vigna angularis var. angularis]|uniref:Uncharacterized protein n=1 Tax=Vigna angularis var. angularis TaxID=157739 RepID=A0A0S3SUH6_PHAAN|nr:hypothetical protein VIGAN_08344500 [Vigna angularis var. angularis]
MDFRGIGKVEKDFIPLLEEVCSRYPSLVDIRKKRSQIFTQWSFTALGRVFHFLNTKRVRDMQSFPNFKPHVDRVLEMKRLEKNVTILDMEVKTFLTKVDDVKEGFEECDLDVELRYDDGEKDLVKRMSYQEMLEAAFQMNTQAALLTLSVTETAAEGRFEQLKEKMDKALQVNLELNAKLHEMTIAQADCEKKQEDKATRLSETRVTEKRAIEACRKLRKNNDDLSLKCQNMKKVIEELVAQNTELIQEKERLYSGTSACVGDVIALQRFPSLRCGVVVSPSSHHGVCTTQLKIPVYSSLAFCC